VGCWLIIGAIIVKNLSPFSGFVTNRSDVSSYKKWRITSQTPYIHYSKTNGKGVLSGGGVRQGGQRWRCVQGLRR